VRYLSEGSPRLKDVAKVTASLAKLEPLVADESSLASYLRIEERELEAGGMN
jgi:hypothetical protein